ncbi:MAG TPA: RidA family protein [Stellaceae bacterium]|nr:RidA family protein [Stellaceae bacterium]
MPFTEIRSPHIAVSPAPYSQATLAQPKKLLHISGQVPVDSAGKTVAVGDIAGQTEQVIRNIQHLLAEAGASFADVCKLTVFMTSRDHYPAVSEVRKRLFPKPYPATSAVIVAGLANPEWLIEIEAVAALD